MDTTIMKEIPWEDLSLAHIGEVVCIFDDTKPADWSIGRINGIFSENRGLTMRVTLENGAVGRFAAPAGGNSGAAPSVRLLVAG